MHRHIPTAILLLLMIVLFVSMDETFLPQLLTALAVDVGEPRAALRQGVVLEDICHVMEQPRHRKKYLQMCIRDRVTGSSPVSSTIESTVF